MFNIQIKNLSVLVRNLYFSHLSFRSHYGLLSFLAHALIRHKIYMRPLFHRYRRSRSGLKLALRVLRGAAQVVQSSKQRRFSFCPRVSNEAGERGIYILMMPILLCFLSGLHLHTCVIFRRFRMAARINIGRCIETEEV